MNKEDKSLKKWENAESIIALIKAFVEFVSALYVGWCVIRILNM